VRIDSEGQYQKNERQENRVAEETHRTLGGTRKKKNRDGTCSSPNLGEIKKKATTERKGQGEKI